jgi:hypothetical protein
MRHVLAPGLARPVAGLAGGVTKPAAAAVLIPAAGVLQGPPAGGGGAGARAVPLPAVAASAQVEELATVRSGAEAQSQRIHALPRSGRGGLDNPETVCEEGSGESRAPNVWDLPEGPGCPDSGPSPSAPSAGMLYLNSPRLRNWPRRGRSRIPRFPVIVNTRR